MDQGQDVVIVYRGSEVISRTMLRSGMIIGRAAGVDLQPEDPSLSRKHAMLQSDAGRWFVVDQNSLNGTFMNGQRLSPMQPAQIVTGDIVELGGFKLHFHLASQPSTTVPPLSQPVTPPFEPPPSASPLLEHLVERHRDIPIWKEGDVQLKVADIIEETHDAKTFRLVGLSPLLFSFKPGQFVTLKLTLDGKEVHRSYTISSSPSRPHCLEITIKRVRGGLVSNWMCDHIKFGDLLSVRGPSGKFSCFNFPSRKILFIAAGSGITPVISMLRWIVDTAADIDAHLLVSAKSPRDIIFRNELNWMSSRHSGIRVGVTCTSRITGADSWTGLTGRCDARMLKLFTPDLLERHIFMCGPGPFMDCSQGLPAGDSTSRSPTCTQRVSVERGWPRAMKSRHAMCPSASSYLSCRLSPLRQPLLPLPRSEPARCGRLPSPFHAIGQVRLDGRRRLPARPGRGKRCGDRVRLPVGGLRFVQGQARQGHGRNERQRIARRRARRGVHPGLRGEADIGCRSGCLTKPHRSRP